MLIAALNASEQSVVAHEQPTITGSVGLWVFASVDLCVFKSVGLWVSGSVCLQSSVGLWVSGSSALWVFGSVGG